MRDNIYNLLSVVITSILITLAFVTPLLFSSLFTDFYDIPKLVLLVPATILLLGLWVLSWVVRGKILIRRTPLDIPLLVLLLTILTSVYFSTSRYSSVYGVLPEVHGSAVSWITYILLYFVISSNIRGVGQVKILLYAFYGSASIISLISIFSFFGIYLPFEMAQGVNFTPTGTSFSTLAMLVMLLPLPLLSIVQKNKFMPQSAAVLLSVLYSTTIALVGTGVVYLILIFLYASVFYVSRRHLSKVSVPLLSVPVALASLLMLLVSVSFSGNALNSMKNNFPHEVQLPASISWKISASAFRDAPFLGTGPATYLYNFTNYKPIEFNQLDFWSFNFGSAYNEFLQSLGVWGMVGFLTLVTTSIVILAVSKRYLSPDLPELRQVKDDTDVILPALALSGVLSVLLLLIHVTTLVSIITTLFLMAAFMVSQKPIRDKTSDLSWGVKISTSKNNQIDLLPVFVFVLFVIAAVPVSAKTYNAVAADYYHRLAVSQADQDGTKTYEYLQRAEALNPYIDLYRVDMAQTNFALANSLAALKGPTEDNPDGSLTEEDRQTIQTLISQAINEGRASVLLAPRSARNWEVLALLYRNISGVAENAITFSLDAYGRAIQMDPLNPALRISVGSLYFATENYDLAARFFTDAVNLKPDYANGYYNLAIALRARGDLQNAQLMAEQAVRLLQHDSGSTSLTSREVRARDLNTASLLLSQIQDDINSGVEAPSADGSVLQNPDLPSIEVPDLENPPDTQLPPVVEENPEAELPDITPED